MWASGALPVTMLHMNDFSAPQLKDTDPPRVFTTVTSKAVSYNMDFVEYLMGLEIERRLEANKPAMTIDQANDLRRQIIAKVIIQQDPIAAANLRSEDSVAIPLTTKQLNG